MMIVVMVVMYCSGDYDIGSGNGVGGVSDDGYDENKYMMVLMMMEMKCFTFLKIK